MPPSFRRSLPIAGVAALVTAAQALAETPAGASPHVRAEAAGTRALVATLVERSVTARTLVDRLNRSDVVVYIRHRAFTGTTLDGRIGIVRSSGPLRYLIVELACDRPTVEQLIALGHELQHAVEIADAVQVVDAPTLIAHYMRIGTQTNAGSPVLTFETDAARETSTQVRRELVGAWRTTHEGQ